MTIAVISGGFDPIHRGHIQLIREAAKLGDVHVLLNSDSWLTRKKGKPFMDFAERKSILEAIGAVKAVHSFDDTDDSCINGLKELSLHNPGEKILFCNGGDRTSENIPENNVDGVTCIFGVGGEYKANSSSDLIAASKYIYSEERQWGVFHNLFEDKGYKVKRLEVAPGKSLSFQRHKLRGEVWVCIEGGCITRHSHDEGIAEDCWESFFEKDSSFPVRVVPAGHWHQIYNPYSKPCVIIETQYGDQCIEEDIERIETPPVKIPDGDIGC